MSQLWLVRHGQSVYNEQNLFTGWLDPALTEGGKQEARLVGKLLHSQKFKPDLVYTSMLTRAHQTMCILLSELEMLLPPIEKSDALNERHYGDLQGKNKEQTAKEFGAAQVHLWRRSFDVPPPNGESLKDTAARTLPYFKKSIVPALESGKNILIVAHGNSLRSIVMDVEKLSPEQILKKEIPTGGALRYQYKTGIFTPA
jgi:2,3-bisphosphoglycerate-dependent phosphoglycerate mutase